jgi:polyisoprenyl-phosphate glycosyltransferase
MSKTPLISVISPVYGASSLLEELVRRIKGAVSLITEDYEIILVEDRGPDNSWEIIGNICDSDQRVIGIRHSRNFGQQYALNCGLDNARGKWIVTLDCDLQDRPEEIVSLYNKALEGYDIVLASRQHRQDGYLKKFFSWVFYHVLAFLTDTLQDPSVANFAIYHRKVVDALKSMGDYSRYYPTMNQWVGFHRIKLDVKHAEREDGNRSSYTLKKRLNLAFDTIISFSNKPLRLTVQFGILTTLIPMFVAIGLVLRYFLGGQLTYVSGWASIFLSLWFFSGLMITILGMIGVYIGKIFETVKGRPTYIVDEKINQEKGGPCI